MSARLSQRFYTCVGILLLLAGMGIVAACDNGEVAIKPLPAASGTGDAGALAQAGTGGGPRGGSGSAGEGHGDSDGTPRLPPPPCGERTQQDQELDLEQEQELREALAEAFDSGKYCPNAESNSRRGLALDRDLEWRARGLICITFDTFGWRQIRGTPVWAWALWDVPNVEDAKKALLGGDHSQLCEEAERTPFRYVGVGHFYDTWIVFLSPGTPDDMQKP